MASYFSKRNAFLSLLFAAAVFEVYYLRCYNSQSGSLSEELDGRNIYQDLILLILAISLPIILAVCMMFFFICRDKPENQEEGMKDYCKQEESWRGIDYVDDRGSLPEISSQSMILDPNNPSIPVVKAKVPKAPTAPNSAPRTFTSILKKAVTFSNVLASFEEDDGSYMSSASPKSRSRSSTRSTSSDSMCDDADGNRSSSSSLSGEDHPQQFSQVQRKTVTFINPFAESVNRFDKPYQRHTPTSKTYSHITGITSDPDLPVAEEIIQSESDLDIVLESDDRSDHENHDNFDHQRSRQNAILKKAVTFVEDDGSGRPSALLSPKPMTQEDSIEKFYRRPSSLTHSSTEPGPWKEEKENDNCRSKSMPNLHTRDEIPTRLRQNTYPGYRSCHGSVAHLHCLYLDGESVGISLDDDIKNFEFDDYGNAYEKEMGVIFVNDDGQKVAESFKPQYGDFCR